MGLFSDDRELDILVIRHCISSCVAHYNLHSASATIFKDVHVNVNDDFEHIIGHISDAGDRIVNGIFENPTALDRIATLLILTNSIPMFSLTRKGKRFLDIQARNVFLAHFSCLLVIAAISILDFADENGNRFGYRWKGFKNGEFKTRFHIFLEWTPGIRVTAVPPTKSQKEDDSRVLAQAALGCALLLEQCVERFIPSSGELSHIPPKQLEG
jgi:hypothetical protein